MNNINFGNQNFGKSGDMIVRNVKKSSADLSDSENEENSWKETALELIAKGRLKEALATVKKAHETDDHVRNQVVILLGRISLAEEEAIAGTVSKQSQAEEIGRIRQGIVSLIASL